MSESPSQAGEEGAGLGEALFGLALVALSGLLAEQFARRAGIGEAERSAEAMARGRSRAEQDEPAAAQLWPASARAGRAGA